MGWYSTSSGDRYTTEEINRKSDKVAKELIEIQFLEHGYNFCSVCLSNNDKPIDVAHLVSRKEAKESGRAELCWDMDNMKIMGRDCHKKHDKNYIQSGKI